MSEVLRKMIENLPSDEYARRRIAYVSGKTDLTDEEVAHVQEEFRRILEACSDPKKIEEPAKDRPM